MKTYSLEINLMAEYLGDQPYYFYTDCGNEYSIRITFLYFSKMGISGLTGVVALNDVDIFNYTYYYNGSNDLYMISEQTTITKNMKAALDAYMFNQYHRLKRDPIQC